MKNLELFYLKIRWSDPSGLPKGKVFIPNRELMFKYEELSSVCIGKSFFRAWY